MRRGISVQVKRKRISAVYPVLFGPDESYSRRAFCTDRPKLRRLERLRSSSTPRLSRGENTFMDLKVSCWSSAFRPNFGPGTNAARRPTAHKVKPDQVEAYKEAASVTCSMSHHCIYLTLIFRNAEESTTPESLVIRSYTSSFQGAGRRWLVNRTRFVSGRARIFALSVGELIFPPQSISWNGRIIAVWTRRRNSSRLLR